ncbi:MAG: hypothetical protein VYD19_01360, partial [Myxococcota bacterium]|nr:hypothetical protein [Myxococcota bacterium]
MLDEQGGDPCPLPASRHPSLFFQFSLDSMSRCLIADWADGRFDGRMGELPIEGLTGPTGAPLPLRLAVGLAASNGSPLSPDVTSIAERIACPPSSISASCLQKLWIEAGEEAYRWRARSLEPMRRFEGYQSWRARQTPPTLGLPDARSMKRWLSEDLEVSLDQITLSPPEGSTRLLGDLLELTAESKGGELSLTAQIESTPNPSVIELLKVDDVRFSAQLFPLQFATLGPAESKRSRLSMSTSLQLIGDRDAPEAILLLRLSGHSAARWGQARHWPEDLGLPLLIPRRPWPRRIYPSLFSLLASLEALKEAGGPARAAMSPAESDALLLDTYRAKLRMLAAPFALRGEALLYQAPRWPEVGTRPQPWGAGARIELARRCLQHAIETAGLDPLEFLQRQAERPLEMTRMIGDQHFAAALAEGCALAADSLPANVLAASPIGEVIAALNGLGEQAPTGPPRLRLVQHHPSQRVIDFSAADESITLWHSGRLSFTLSGSEESMLRALIAEGEGWFSPEPQTLHYIGLPPLSEQLSVIALDRHGRAWPQRVQLREGAQLSPWRLNIALGGGLRLDPEAHTIGRSWRLWSRATPGETLSLILEGHAEARLEGGRSWRLEPLDPTLDHEGNSWSKRWRLSRTAPEVALQEQLQLHAVGRLGDHQLLSLTVTIDRRPPRLDLRPLRYRDERALPSHRRWSEVSLLSLSPHEDWSVYKWRGWWGEGARGCAEDAAPELACADLFRCLASDDIGCEPLQNIAMLSWRGGDQSASPQKLKLTVALYHGEPPAYVTTHLARLEGGDPARWVLPLDGLRFAMEADAVAPDLEADARLNPARG